MIRAIAAIDNKNGLASETGIPWDLPTDRAFARKMTEGSNLLMGYGTYIEFSKPDKIYPSYLIKITIRTILEIFHHKDLFYEHIVLAYSLHVHNKFINRIK